MEREFKGRECACRRKTFRGKGRKVFAKKIQGKGMREAFKGRGRKG